MACGFGACFGCVVPDPQRLRAPVRRRPGRRRRRARDRARPGERALTPAREIELCGVPLRGPVLNGSGTFDAIAARRTFGDALLERFPFDAFVSKTITLAPRQGNPPPRLWETPAGLINSIGLPNKGLDGFLASDLPELARAARAACRVGHGLQPRRARGARRPRRRARRGRDDRVERVVPERRDRSRHGRRPRRDDARRRAHARAHRQAVDREADAERVRAAGRRGCRAGRGGRRGVAHQHAEGDGAPSAHARRRGSAADRAESRVPRCARSRSSRSTRSLARSKFR